MRLTLSMTEILLLVFVAGLGGYGAHGLLAKAPAQEAGGSAATAVIEQAAPVPSNGTELSSRPAAPRASTKQPAFPADGGQDEAFEAAEFEPDPPPHDPGFEGPDAMGPRGLEPDYALYLEELEALEEAEDAAERQGKAPDPAPSLTQEELGALDEAEEAKELAEYDLYLMDLADQAEESRWSYEASGPGLLPE